MTQAAADQYVSADQSIDIDLDAPEKNPFLVDAGTYLVRIKDAKKKDSKNTQGAQFIEVHLEILDGPSKGSVIVDRLNIKNPKEVAARLGQKRLRQLALAAGLTKLTKTSDLITNKVISIDVTIQKSANPQFDDSNSVTNYAGTNVPAPAIATPAAPAPVAGWNPGGVDPDAV